MTTCPTYAVGARVLACGTPGALSQALRDGGIGTITEITGPDKFNNLFYHVALDADEFNPQPYLNCDLAEAPTV